MSAESIINKVKYNKAIYKLYKIFGGLALGVLKRIVKPEDDLILFVCFGGRKYDDSPRCIYEAMIDDRRFDSYRLVWAFMDPDRHELKGRGRKIKMDTMRYCVTALKARVWVTNSNVDRGLSFKGKHTFYFNTWHGSAIKRLGADMATQPFAYAPKHKNDDDKLNLFDVFCAQSEYDIRVFSHAFNISEKTFRITGLPRNDELVFNNQKTVIDSLKKKIGAPDDKTIILYAPTFREYQRDEGNKCVLSVPMDLDKWKITLGDQYFLLFRAHYEVVRLLNVKDNQFVLNVSDYPNLNELMLVSDICISDYSSIFIDYSVLGRPMLCWAYDCDEYCAKRGLYFDIRSALGNEAIKTEDDLLNTIQDMNHEERRLVTEQFRQQYVEEYGKATAQSLDIIADNLNIR